MKKAVLFLIGIYRKFVSPALPPACRFYPSCSEYAHEAVERHGVIRGAALSTRRILKCHPYNLGGYDPVPPVKTLNIMGLDPTFLSGGERKVAKESQN
jgi:putative membrane protein insertion efficiency factor